MHELGLLKEKKTLKQDNDYLNQQKVFANKKEKEKEKLELPVPERFSFSQYQAFKTCPLQYKFNFILKVPTKGKHNFSFGKTIHSTLEKFVSNWKQRKKTKQKDLFSKGEDGLERPLSLEDLLNIYKEEWIDDWYNNKRHKKEYRKKGKEMLKSFYKRFCKEQPQVVGVEKSFNVKLGGNNLLGK